MKPLPNDSRMEFMFGVVEGQPPAQQKRLIVEAAQEQVGLLDDQQAGLLIDALGLKEA